MINQGDIFWIEHRSAMGQGSFVLSCVPFIGGYILRLAVAMFKIILQCKLFNPFPGILQAFKRSLRYQGRYLRVLYSDTEYELSFITLVLENEGITPKCCRVASMVTPFMGESSTDLEIGLLPGLCSFESTSCASP